MGFHLAVTTRLAAIATLVCCVSGCAATTAGTATPAAPVPLTTEAGLPTLLLSASDVGSALGGQQTGEQMVVTREVSTPWDHSAHFPAGTDPGCLAITGAAQAAVYDGSGWTALRAQVLREPPSAPMWSHFATQAVVLFADAEAAAAFFSRSRDAWAGCSGREMTYAQQLAPDQVWSVGPAVSDAGMLTVSRAQRVPEQWSCQRALTVRGNVAVDVEACSLDGPTSAAATIVGAIGERLPAA